MILSKYHILVVDDDAKIRSLLTRYLQSNGYYVSVSKNAAEAREIIKDFKFDLIILDVMMPGESGVSFTSNFRSYSDIPIILLTAMGEVNDRINGIDKGADDYLVKPFEPKELLVRMNRLLSRSAFHYVSTNLVKFGKFEFNIEKNVLKDGEKHIKFTNSESHLFKYLFDNIGKSVSREELSKNLCINERSVDVQIIRIRSKIEENPKNPIYLQTVRGKGYILFKD